MNKKNMSSTFIGYTTLLLLSMCIIQSNTCYAQSNNSVLLNGDPQKLARAIGHFEKARSLLLAAVREFDSGYEIAKTDQLIDTDLWRKSLLARAEELETVVSPKAREINIGSRYAPDSRLIGAKAKPPLNIKSNQEVNAQSSPSVESGSTEAKDMEPQTKENGELDLEISGS